MGGGLACKRQSSNASAATFTMTAGNPSHGARKRFLSAASPEFGLHAEVRQAQEVRAGADASEAAKKRPADRSKPVVAVLDDRRRVIDDGVQWILQKRHGRPTRKSTGWRGRSYCTSRKSLLDSVEKWCEPPIDPDALRNLQALPDDHPKAGRSQPTRGRRARNA